jgi:hypothetical protein
LRQTKFTHAIEKQRFFNGLRLARDRAAARSTAPTRRTAAGLTVTWSRKENISYQEIIFSNSEEIDFPDSEETEKPNSEEKSRFLTNRNPIGLFS